MTISDSLNSIKDAVSEAEKLIPNLPVDFQKSAQKDMDSIRTIVVQLATSIQKKQQDDEINEKLREEIFRNMQSSNIYSDLSEIEKEEIAAIVLESSDKELLDLDELSAFYVKTLRRSTPSDLVDNLYTKKNILDFGKGIVPKEMTDEIAYNAAYEVLENNAKLPQKREEMIQMATKDFRKDKDSQKTVLKNYYGI